MSSPGSTSRMLLSGAAFSDITYSHDATVAAFKSYFEFLTKMYMDPDAVKTPPVSGWEHITRESMQAIGKSKEVINLLRHLPYVSQFLGRPETHTHPTLNGYDVSCTTEFEHTPPHVIGISEGPYKMLLDTKLGVVYFTGCPPVIHEDSSHPFPPVQADAVDYASEEELEWRESPAWPISEFFEVLKYHFARLDYVPLSRRCVEEGWVGNEGDVPDTLGACRVAKEIFVRHDWPDLGKFRKYDSMAELEREIPRKPQ